MKRKPRQVPLAIIGMGCRFPGANDLDEFWNVIRHGKSTYCSIPESRLNRELYFSPEKGITGKSYSEIGGIVEDSSPPLADVLLTEEQLQEFDSAHLTFCDVVVSAIKNAGYQPRNLPTRNVGVYVGHAGGSCDAGDLMYSAYIEEVAAYLDQIQSTNHLSQFQLNDLKSRLIDSVRGEYRPEQLMKKKYGANQAAGLVSRAFGLNGPQEVVDAACASSLVALFLASQALQTGQIEMAVVGGASYSKWYGMVLFSHAQSLSATGSRPFDHDADGLISSDGCGALLVKTMQKAIADNDQILGVIDGIGISSDGRGKSLWAPLETGQRKAVSRAYHSPEDMSRVQYIECHATSTQLGDATELNALGKCFTDRSSDNQSITIGSVKGNIGHTLEAAGIAGLIKTVLSLKHGVIPPQANISELNTNIDWHDLPFVVPTTEQNWESPPNGEPRAAAVNAFGIGGLNVHVALVDHVSRSRDSKSLSGVARTQSELPEEPIAVVGMGSLFGHCHSPQSLWDCVSSGELALSRVPADRWSESIYFSPGSKLPFRQDSNVGGFVTDYEYDWRRHKIPPKQIKSSNPLQYMLLDAAESALEQCGYIDSEGFDRDSTAVVVGTVFGGDFSCQLQMGLRLPDLKCRLKSILNLSMNESEQQAIIDDFASLLLEKLPALNDETGSFTSSTLASRLAKTFDVHGGAFAVDADNGSSIAALNSAVSMLRLQHADTIICAAGQRSMDLMMFDNVREMHQGANTSNRFRPGEGVGVVVLKRLSDAKAESLPILGVIHRCGIATDHAGLVAATEQSLNQVFAKDPQDLKKLQVLESDFEQSQHERYSRGQAALLIQSNLIQSSAVDQFGFGFGVSGMLSLQKAILQMQHGKCIPKKAGTRAESIRLRDTTGNGTTMTVVQNTACPGQAWHVLVEGGDQLPKSTAEQSRTADHAGLENGKPADPAPFVYKLQDSDISSLRQKVNHLSLNKNVVDSKESRFVPNQLGPRIAFVSESREKLLSSLELATKEWELTKKNRFRSRGIHFSAEPVMTHEVAVGFPGQGSQYQGMFSEWRRFAPDAEATIREFDLICKEFAQPTFWEMVRFDAQRLKSDLKLTQLSVLGANLFAWEFAKSLGIQPGCFFGHSFGEVAALVAVGSLSVSDAVRLAIYRADAILAHDECRGALVSVFAAPEVVSQFVDYFPTTVFVANINGPEQVVVGGISKALEGFTKLLSVEGIRFKELDVARPFHTPLMEPACEHFGQLIQSIDIRKPETEGFISSVNNQPASSSEEIRENLIRQLSSPLDYISLINSVVNRGIKAIVEVGPKSVLTGLNGRVLPEGDFPFIAIDRSQAKQANQLDMLKLELEICGAIPLQNNCPTINESTMKSESNLKTGGEIIYFDATESRRTKMREQALSGINGVKQSVEPSPVESKRVSNQAQETLDSTEDKHQGDNAESLNGYHHDRQIPNSSFHDSRTSEIGERTDQKVIAEKENVALHPATSGFDSNKLQDFMVEFILEQTGYPADMILPDADLEADLGIDSIRKVQMIGELTEEFGLAHLVDAIRSVSLAEFTTIEQVSAFVIGNSPNQIEGEVESHSTETLVEQESIDLLNGVESEFEQSEIRTSTEDAFALERKELEQFAIDYVVDQTGYPPEIVELDADLEADLGVDSIKKAQLIGECVEAFELHHLVEHVSKRSLDEFSSLEAIISFILEMTSDSSKKKTELQPEHNAELVIESEAAVSRVSLHEADLPSGECRRSDDSCSETADEPQLVEFRGTHYAMGVEHGRHFSREINKILDRQKELLGPRIHELKELTEAQENPSIYFTESAIQEMRGISEGSNIPFEAIVAHNLGLEHSHIPGCSRFAVTKKAIGDLGACHAINEDAPISLALGDILSRLIQVRHPSDGFAHIVFSTAGQVGGLNGINEHGLTVSSCNLNDREQSTTLTKGKIPPIISTEILGKAKNTDEAIAQLKSMDRFGAWSVCITDAVSDEICLVEYDGDEVVIERKYKETRSTNHCQLLSANKEIPEHSQARFNRLSQLFNYQESSEFDVDSVKSAMRDQFDLVRNREVRHPTMNTVRRVDNVASLVFQPEMGVVWVSQGTAKRTVSDDYLKIDLHRVFPKFQDNLNQGKKKQTAETSVDESRVMTRFVLRAVHEPNPPMDDTSGKFTSIRQALIYGSGRDVDHFSHQLEKAGVKYACVETEHSFQLTMDHVEQLLAESTYSHLFLFSAREDQAKTSADSVSFSDRRPAGIDIPFFLCQKWLSHVYQHDMSQDAALVGVVNLGGDFGLESAFASCEGGAMTGLLKSLKREYSEITVKVLDFADVEQAESVTEAVIQELSDRSDRVEVAFAGSNRRVLRTIPENLDGMRVDGWEDRVKGYSGAWIVTGGARGITSVIAKKLGALCNAQLHLLGSTSLSQIKPEWLEYTVDQRKQLERAIKSEAREKGEIPRKVWSKIQSALQAATSIREMKKQGLEVQYHCCDLSQTSEIAAVVDLIRRQGIPITGIIHGAGFESSGGFDRKTFESYRRTLAVKVDAFIKLLQETWADPLKFCIGFGSTSGRFGGLGQSDYSLASDMLAKLCGWVRRQRPDLKATAFHWPPWDEIGMAARPESRLTLMANNVSFMPLEEGVNFVAEEMKAGFPESEVLVFDDPNSMEHGGQALPSSLSGHIERSREMIKDLPLVERIVDSDEGRNWETEIAFEPSIDPFLVDHTHRDIPIMPFVVGIEALLESAMLDSPCVRENWSVKDVKITNGVRFHTDSPISARVKVERRNSKEFGGILSADFRNREGRLLEAQRTHITGIVGFLPMTAPEFTIASSNAGRQWESIDYSPQREPLSLKDSRIQHGPRMQALHQMEFGAELSWARIFVPDDSATIGRKRIGKPLVSIGAFDACLAAIDRHFQRAYQTAQLPYRIGELRWYRAALPGEELLLQICEQEDHHHDGEYCVSFTLFDKQHAVVADAKSVLFRQTSTSGAKVPSSQKGKTSVTPDGSLTTEQMQTAEQLPLISTYEPDSAGGFRAYAQFYPTKDLFLSQHRIDGVPVLPAVVGIETLVEAAAVDDNRFEWFRVSDFVVSDRMSFSSDDPRELQLHVESSETMSHVTMRSDDPPKVWQSANIEFGHSAPPLTDCENTEPFHPYGKMQWRKDGTVYHGRVFRSLTEMSFQRDDGWANLTAPSSTELFEGRDGGLVFLPAVLLDSAFVACGAFSWVLCGQRIEVPAAVKSLVVLRKPEVAEQCRQRLFIRNQDRKTSEFDFTIFGQGGDVILQVEGFQTRLVGRGM